MRTLRTTAALAIALTIGASAMTSHVASAASRHTDTSVHTNTATSGPSSYNIFAWGNYCADGASTCSIYGGQFRQADVEAYGAPGAYSGMPQTVYVECDKYFTDGSGHQIDEYEVVNGFSVAASVFGSASLGPNPSETNTASVGRQSYYAKDGETGDSAWVSGTQTANNVTDHNVSGGFTVTMSGTIYENGFPSGNGTMTCSTAKILPGQATAENEYEASQSRY